MAILLTTPKVFDPGHNLPQETYTLVTIVRFDLQIISRLVRFTMQYGNLVNDKWVNGQLPDHMIVVRDSPAIMGSGIDPEDGVFKEQEVKAADPAFSTMAAQLLIAAGSVGKDYLTELGDGLYQYFIDDGHYVGTIT